jgi:hypothetical protein
MALFRFAISFVQRARAMSRTSSVFIAELSKASTEQPAGVLLDDTRFEICRADVEDASYDAIASQDVGRLAVRPDAVLHRYDRSVRMHSGDRTAGVLDIL